MTVLHSRGSKQFADNWEQIFGGPTRSTAKKNAAVRKPHSAKSSRATKPTKRGPAKAARKKATPSKGSRK